ncbi:MAG: hypothetical protein Q9198_010905, partial [Flavoplaca austrocitrina]
SVNSNRFVSKTCNHLTMSSEANGTGESTTYTPQRGITKSDDTSLAKTEWVKRTRPEALTRRLSASDAALQGNASLQRPVLEEGTQTAKDPKGDKRGLGSFGIPAPVVPPAQRLGSVRLGHDAVVDASLHHPPEFRRGESPTINQDDGCKTFSGNSQMVCLLTFLKYYHQGFASFPRMMRLKAGPRASRMR